MKTFKLTILNIKMAVKCFKHWTIFSTHRFTSCFMSLILASRGQHFLLLYPTIFSLLGSGCSVRYL